MSSSDFIDLWNDTITNYCEQNSNNLFNEEVVKPTKFFAFQNNELIIVVEKDEHFPLLNECKNEMQKICNQISNNDHKLVFIKNSDKEQYKKNKKSSFDTSLTFDNYLISDFNVNAYKLMQSVFENGTSLFNPIFIYGKTGLGKTHLAVATANKFNSLHPNMSLHYVESQMFIREIFRCFEEKNSNQIEDLKERYSNYDVLIIEDVQYLADKTKTNEILFTIFNNLTNSKKIIIMTSDRAPHELNGFEDRMISRFSSGISCKIDDPSLQVLQELVIKTLTTKNITLTENASLMIANFCDSDIRKLLGIINKIIFFSSTQNLEVNKVLDENIIKTILEIDNKLIGNTKKINFAHPSKIIETVAKIYNVKTSDLTGNSRKKNIANARHMAMYIMRDFAKLQLKDIGGFLGNRDHTTVLNGVERIKSLISSDKEFNKLVSSIVKKLSY